MYAHLCMQKSEEGFRLPAVRVTSGHEWLNLGAGIQTRFLFKSSKNS